MREVLCSNREEGSNNEVSGALPEVFELGASVVKKFERIEADVSEGPDVLVQESTKS